MPNREINIGYVGETDSWTPDSPDATRDVGNFFVGSSEEVYGER